MAEPLMGKIETMSGMIDIVAEFRDDVNGGIGYSMYYYAQAMRSNPNVKLIALDGVEPTTDNIRSGLYPVIINYYAVKRSNDDSETTRKLLDFVMSDEGQSCVNESGLVSIR